jgi:hypothetical protein
LVWACPPSSPRFFLSDPLQHSEVYTGLKDIKGDYGFSKVVAASHLTPSLNSSPHHDHLRERILQIFAIMKFLSFLAMTLGFMAVTASEDSEFTQIVMGFAG